MDVTIDITIDAGIRFVTGGFQNPPVTPPLLPKIWGLGLPKLDGARSSPQFFTHWPSHAGSKPEPSLPKSNSVITIDITMDVTIDISIHAGTPFVTGGFQNPPVTSPKIIA